MKKLLMLIVTLALCIGICINLRGNRVETTFKKEYDTKDKIDFSLARYAFGKHRESRAMDFIDLDDYEDLVKASSLIVDVKYVSRKQMLGAIETTVEVKKVYKGQCRKRITIYEAGFVDEERISLIQSRPLMNDGDTYLLFLMKAIPKDGRYYSLVNTVFGRYRRGKDTHVVHVNESNSGEASLKKNELNDAELVYVHYRKESIEYDNAQDNVDTYYRSLNQYESFRKKALKQYK